jgi:glyoxylase-like metal-dependent hydrolase (beta-lactamase superfamily II)
MMPRRILTSFLAFCLFVFPAFAVDEVPIDFERLSDRVLIVKCGKVYFDQVIAIATQRGIVMIDTGMAPTLAAEYRRIIERELGRDDFIYVINTHYHSDHTNGNGVFADAAIIAHESSPERLRELQEGLDGFIESRHALRARFQNQLERAEPGSYDALRTTDLVYTMGIMIQDLEDNFQVSLPTMTFRDRMTLDLGDLTLRLVYFGKGRHTGDDILIHCPEEKLLFTGDLFYKESMWVSTGPQFDVERWIEAMNCVLQDTSQVKLVFDAHNGRMKGSFIVLWRDYLVELWKSVNAAKDEGLELEEIQKQLAYDPRFTYLEKSGLGEEQLRREHQSNLRYMWYRVNEMQSATTILEQTLTESGPEGFKNKCNELRAAKYADYYFDETELNRLGYRLMNRDEFDQAILVFQINVELYPDSSNAYDSLGEVYMIRGEKELAIENYQRSLELNPNNTNAAEKLKTLRKSR